LGPLGPLGFLAVGASGGLHSDRGGGRVADEVVIGAALPVGGLAGLAVGPVVELDELEEPRGGAHATAWLAAGVVPYIRVARVLETATSLEIGLAIPLPVVRW